MLCMANWAIPMSMVRAPVCEAIDGPMVPPDLELFLIWKYWILSSLSLASSSTRAVPTTSVAMCWLASRASVMPTFGLGLWFSR